MPELSERSLGWLRYLHRKATTPDDWSRGGRPHPHWDDRSHPPMASWHRFDLVFVAVINALYLAPQRPDDARRLYDAGLGMIGALGSGPANAIGERNTGVALLLAREWGDTATAERLAAAAEASYEPAWDRDRGEFTWGFNLHEEHPRGQSTPSWPRPKP